MTNAKANPFVSYSLMTLFGIVLIGAFFSYAMTVYGAAAVTPWIVFCVFCGFLFLMGRWLVKGIKIAQQFDPTTPSTICSVETSYEASLVVSKLAEAGIQATAVGGFVSGFQVEAPGYVDVVVAKEDLQAAVEVVNTG